MSQELHQLVHSLTKAEKRQFRLLNTQASGAEGNHLKLFDAILGQEVYDEDQLRALFEGQPLLNHFAVAKGYLQDSILHSLRSGKAPASADGKIRRMQEDVAILHGKGLHSQALRILDRGLLFAQEMENPAAIAEFLRWKRRLVNSTTTHDRIALLDEIEAAETQALEHLLLDGKLRSLRAKVQSLMARQVEVRTGTEMDELNQIMQHPALQSDPAALPFHTRQTLWNILGSWNRMVHHVHKSLHFYHLAAQDWEMHPKILKAHPDQYLNALVTFLDTALSAHQFADFRAKQSGFTYISTTEPRIQAQVFYYQTHLSLRYSLLTGDFIPGIKAAQALEKGLQAHAKFLNLSVELALLYNLASVHFLSLHFREAVRTIALILNRQSGEVRHDIFDAARLLLLVAHYELGNFDVLDSLLRAQERRNRLHPHAAEFEQVLVHGLRRLASLPPADRKAYFPKIQTKMAPFAHQAHFIGQDEINFWLRSKVEGRIPAEIIKQDAGY